MKRTGENGLAQMRMVLVFAGALLAGGLSYLMAQEFRVTSIALGPDGRPQIQHEAETNYYYILYRGPLTNIVMVPDFQSLDVFRQGTFLPRRLAAVSQGAFDTRI